jgi:hypothetical protein
MGILDQMKEQIKAVEAEAFRALEAGMPVPGWKLVLKQTRRYWIDAQAVLRKLRYDRRVSKDQYIEEVLRSPAQVEKAVKKAGVDLSEFIESRSSGTTIAPASDPRPAVEKNAPVPEALENLFKSAVG